jgi:hypothetical protein
MIFGAALAVFGFACDRPAAIISPTDQNTMLLPSDDQSPPSPSKMSPRAAAALEKIVSEIGEPSGAILRDKLLADHTRVRLPNNPRVQSLIDGYYQIKEDESRARTLIPVPATLALVDALPGNVDALVIRQKGRGDYIVLQSDKASVDALGTAVSMLYKLRKESGDIAYENMRVAITSPKVPKSWDADLVAHATAELKSLRHATPKRVAGFEAARAMEIALISTNAGLARK